jgi:hypothetical protein
MGLCFFLLVLLVSPRGHGASAGLQVKATRFSPSGAICGGKTERGSTPWERYGTLGLSVHIDTRQCGFSLTEAPRYFSSVAGDEMSWALTGTNSIYEPTANGFRLLAYHPTMAQKLALVYAQMQWTVSWIGMQGLTSGSTDPGLDWKQYGPHSLSIDVKTHGEKSTVWFTKVPRYIVSFQSAHTGWPVIGVHSIYRPTETSFRVYALSQKKSITPEQAWHYKWSINWYGCNDAQIWCGSSLDAKWVAAKDSHPASSMSVVTTGKNAQPIYKRTPAYVTTLQATKQFASDDTHQWVVDAGSIFHTSNRGFVTYIEGGTTAWMSGFNVNYLAFEAPVDCLVGPWSTWVGSEILATACSRECGGGHKHRSRAIRGTPNALGIACPATRETIPCNTKACAQDCKVGKWSSWDPCNAKRCGFQRVRVRRRNVLQTATFGGAPCPALEEKMHCKAVPCSGSGSSRACGSVTRSKWKSTTSTISSEWKLYKGTSPPFTPEAGIYIEVSTTFCNFEPSTPVFYIASVVADGASWKSVGVSSVYRTTFHSFVIDVWHPTLLGIELLQYAQKHDWRVSWMGDTSSSCGQTVSGETGWKQTGNKDLLFVDVSTAASHFAMESTPHYVTALHGMKTPCRAQGGHDVYSPTFDSFRLYTTFREEQRAQDAEIAMFNVVWVVVPGSTAFSSSNWEQEGDSIYTDVNSKTLQLPSGGDHVYVTSVTGMNDPIAGMYGAGTISQPFSGGFRLYLGPPNPSFGSELALHARRNGWRVNFIGFQMITCHVSSWGQWGQCSRSCGVGHHSRVREVTRSPLHHKCPALVLKQECSLYPCPGDCVVSAWSNWGRCSKACGGGFKKRMRVVIRLQNTGGKLCPSVSDLAPCSPLPCTRTTQFTVRGLLHTKRAHLMGGVVAPIKLKAALAASIGVMPNEVIVMPTSGHDTRFAILCASAETSKNVKARILTGACVKVLAVMLSHVGASVPSSALSLRLQGYAGRPGASIATGNQATSVHHPSHQAPGTSIFSAAAIGLSLCGFVLLITLGAAAFGKAEAGAAGAE